MGRLTHEQIVLLLLSLAVLLAVARALGELARRFNQPAVLGEILAGILLGPTALGWLAPGLVRTLFPSTGEIALVMNGVTTLAIVLFLLVAGIEVDLSTIWRLGRSAAFVSAAGIAIPFLLGLATVTVAPDVLGRDESMYPAVFPLFFATALSISALPVIARTLMDLKLFRSDMGMIVIAAAVFDDLAGWTIFAVILGMLGTATGHGHGVPFTVVMILGFVVVMLSAGRAAIHRALAWVQAYTTWPGGVLGFAIVLTLLGAAFTEWIGVHAIFGAFFVGIAIGDSSHLRQQTRTMIEQFVSFIFAPLFFASIGLRVNFVQHFDPVLCAIVFVIACLGKVVGCGAAARLGGLSRRESLAVGFGMNARGAMEIILGVLALQHHVIGERMFVALVVMALATSMIGGPAMQRVLRLRRPRRLGDLLDARAFIRRLSGTTRRDVIQELARSTAAVAGLDPHGVESAVWQREQVGSTGMGNGLAVPHARLPRLSRSVVGVGLSEDGIDFDAPDGATAHLVFLILTPETDDGAQIDILSDIARVFAGTDAREQALDARGYTEFLALLRTAEG